MQINTIDLAVKHTIKQPLFLMKNSSTNVDEDEVMFKVIFTNFLLHSLTLSLKL